MGRLNGREGPFPASYVEIVLDSPQRFQELPSPPQHGNFRTGPHPYPQQPQYYGPPVGNMYPSNPISFQGGSGPYSLPPGPPPGTVVVMNTEQSPKKNGFLSGDLGNTVIHFFSSCLVNYSLFSSACSFSCGRSRLWCR